MFVIKFADETVMVEAEVGKWDNVPRDKKIREVGIVIPLADEQKLLLAPLPKGCERYCCTVLARQLVGEKNGHRVGYVLYGVKGGFLHRIALTADGLSSMQITPYREGVIAEKAWRDGC